MASPPHWPAPNKPSDTRLPDVTHGLSLADVIAAVPVLGRRIALDNYESRRRCPLFRLPARHSHSDPTRWSAPSAIAAGQWI